MLAVERLVMTMRNWQIFCENSLELVQISRYKAEDIKHASKLLIIPNLVVI